MWGVLEAEYEVIDNEYYFNGFKPYSDNTLFAKLRNLHFFQSGFVHSSGN